VVTGADAAPVLGIETSCDETAAAVVVGGRQIRSSIVSSQVDLHARFGGVVPELASRAHLELIGPVIAEALGEASTELSDLAAVAACRGPGLAGALLVGVSAAKALALVTGLPYVGVNHLEAHLYAAWLEEPSLEPPLAVLVVSGGHTLLVTMEAQAGTGWSARPSTTPPARRSTRWRAISASGTRGARCSTASRARATPPRCASPGRCRERPTSRSRA